MRPIKLRTVLIAATGAITLLGVLVSLTLVIATTQLHTRSVELAAAVESVALTQQASNDLLLHERAIDGVARHEVERALRHHLDEAAGYVTSHAEAKVLARAHEAVGAYLRTPDDPALLDDAYAALVSLIEVNVAQAKSARAAAAELDHSASLVGVAVAAAVMVIAGLFFWWARRHVIAPLVGVSDAMAQFGAGDRAARAPESGPREIQTISRQFNVMATALVAHRQTQLAFLGGVAHDLRVPVGALTLSIDVLDHASPADVRQATDRMRRIAHRIDRMVGDLLDVTRIEAGRLRVETEPLDVREILQEVVTLVGHEGERPRVRVQVPPAPLMVRGDPMRLEQALGNLVANALKFSAPGELVDVRAQVRATDVVVEVEDRGRGVAPEDRARIFEPYGRGRAGTGVAGFGLGLYVTRGIVEAHGGEIAVDSGARAGAIFRVTLPAMPDQSFRPLSRSQA